MSSASTRCCARVAKAVSKSRSLLAFTTNNCSPRARAATCASLSLRLGRRRGRVDEHTNHAGLRHHLAQEFQLLGLQVGAVEEGNAGDIASGPVESCHEANLHRVVAGREHDGNRRSCRLGGVRCRFAAGYDYSALTANEIGRQRRQSPLSILCPAVFNRNVLSLNITCFSQATSQRHHEFSRSIRRRASEEPDYWHRRLLRARCERPRCRAAEKRDELAPLHLRDHSITSSARSRTASGILSPSALAVVRLMTKSNLVGCSTGMSAGFAPRRILSTRSAARRNRSGKFAP